VLVLSACNQEQHLPEAPTLNQLCQTLGRDPGADPLCNLEHSSLLQLLEASFPPGQATRAEVRMTLDQYYVETQVVNDRTIDTYAILRTLLPDVPDLAIFRFDADGILVRIDVAE
jgi:hypothetical protein